MAGTLATALGGGAARFTPDAEANELLHRDAFAFLLAVICDYGIVAERAWAIPYELQRRIGHLDPARMAGSAEAVRAAFAATPKLHRFVNSVADWAVTCAGIVVECYGGDAARVWNDHPSAAELRARLETFPGIGQKKAAMAVEILERDLDVELADLSGSDIAYDVHVRRVFLRSGLAERDDVAHMVAAARSCTLTGRGSWTTQRGISADGGVVLQHPNAPAALSLPHARDSSSGPAAYGECDQSWSAAVPPDRMTGVISPIRRMNRSVRRVGVLHR